ncbi:MULTISPECIES: hypothetical protein [unclassified Xanthomonas]|uniref:hypothetical protein n=1 Tax=unclassified Xanthomonas TaxID=2643310 RepID=UPI0016075649|nr:MULTISPECIES: hypothetical protein [unclassified Xanthomonas]MBB4132960.1 hypothetical protein [Xanthomonas sp. 3075]MBB5866350.1 hypothetical protein [Xanthomonas sp. 3058]
MKNCPFCSSTLEAIDVAPCFDCGHATQELEHFSRKEHEYNVFELWDREIVLCDFCDADFGSYYPDYWGLPDGPLPIYPLTLLREVDNPSITQDFYCATCKHRLDFLMFRLHAMAHNAA